MNTVYLDQRTKRLCLFEKYFLQDIAVDFYSLYFPYVYHGVSGMVLGKNYFDARPALCDVIATTCLCACVTALFSIGGISFNRYFYICRSAYYSRIFTLRNNLLLCASFWMTGIVITLPALLGWTHNVYDEKLMECHWNRTQSLTFTIFFSVGIIFTPISIISVSYVKIYLFFRASRERVAMSSGLRTQGSVRKNEAAIKLAKTLFVIFIVFSVCWTPYAIMVLVDYSLNFPPEVLLFTVAFAHMHSSLNPVVYGITNHHFREAYARILNFICHCNIIVAPEVSSGPPSLREPPVYSTSRM